MPGLFNLFNVTEIPLKMQAESADRVPTGYTRVSNQELYNMYARITEQDGRIEELERKETDLANEIYEDLVRRWSDGYQKAIMERDQARAELARLQIENERLRALNEDTYNLTSRAERRAIASGSVDRDASSGKFQKVPGTPDKNLIAFEQIQQGEAPENVAALLGVNLSSIPMMVSRGKKKAAAIPCHERVSANSSTFRSFSLKEAIEDGRRPASLFVE